MNSFDIAQFLSSSADLAIIFFAVILWKIDRRLLVVEEQMKSLWRQFTKIEDSDA